MGVYINWTAVATTTASVVASSQRQNDGMLVANTGTSTVFLGSATVTADQSNTGGLQLHPGEKVTISTVSDTNADLYGVTAAGTAVVTFLQVQQ